MEFNLEPFQVKPDSKFQVWNISGGRTSGLMFHLLLKANNGIPDNCEAVFTNTGKEMPQTLDFLNEMEKRWNAPITWLEYDVDWNQSVPRSTRKGKSIHKVVDYKTASRNGEPFEALITRERAIPSNQKRFCTTELKRYTTNRYFSKKGLTPSERTNIMGIRYDEPKRIHMALMEECKTYYPLYFAKITKDDVDRFWRQQPFGLAIDSLLSNCDLCFLKGRAKKMRIIRMVDGVADWWIKMEENNSRGRKYQFREEYSSRELYESAKTKSPTLFPEEQEVSCFCGD